MTISMKDLFIGMAAAFKSQAAGNLRATIQFVISGEDPGTHHLVIENGTCTYHEGPAQNPTVTINAPDTIWRDVTLGQLDATKAFMTGKIKAKGDMGLLMKLPNLFSR